LGFEITDSKHPKEDREAESHGTTAVVRALKVADEAGVKCPAEATAPIPPEVPR
jgi:hypothetical protein